MEINWEKLHLSAKEVEKSLSRALIPMELLIIK